MSGMDRDIGIVPEFFLLKQYVFGIIRKSKEKQNKETLLRKSLWKKCFSGKGFLKAKPNEDIQ
jgi:hypothetical protein